MRYKQYKFKFYLNARHAIYNNGVLGDVHTHSWEFVLYIVKARKEFSQFSQIEEAMENYFEPFQDKCINDIEPFNVINPTLENVADYFKEALSEILNKMGWVLLMMEMSETPARTYVISLLDDVEMSDDQTIDTVTDLILERVRGEVNGSSQAENN